MTVFLCKTKKVSESVYNLKCSSSVLEKKKYRKLGTVINNVKGSITFILLSQITKMSSSENVLVESVSRSTVGAYSCPSLASLSLRGWRHASCKIQQLKLLISDMIPGDTCHPHHKQSIPHARVGRASTVLGREACRHGNSRSLYYPLLPFSIALVDSFSHIHTHTNTHIHTQLNTQIHTNA